MCGIFRPGRAQSLDRARAAGRARSRPRARRRSRTAAACRGRSRAAGRPRARARAAASTRSSAASRRIASGKAPTPGEHDRVRGGDRVALVRAGDARADVLERLLDAAAVAHPVVDERDRHVSVPLVEGTPVSSGSIATAIRSARAKALKQASIMWCAFVPACSSTCSVSRAALATARKNSSAASCSKPAIVPGRQLEPADAAERAAGDVDRARRAGLVHRHHGVAVAADPAAVAERLVERLAEHDAGVLDRVVRPVSRSPWAVTPRPMPAMAREQVEHVVEEADAGVHLARHVAVEVEADLDVGLAGLAAQLCGAAHVVTDSHGSGRTSTPRAPRSPRPRRPGPPARASAAAAPPTWTSAMRRRKWPTLRPDAKRAAPSVGSVWFEPAT